MCIRNRAAGGQLPKPSIKKIMVHSLTARVTVQFRDAVHTRRSTYNNSGSEIIIRSSISIRSRSRSKSGVKHPRSMIRARLIYIGHAHRSRSRSMARSKRPLFISVFFGMCVCVKGSRIENDRATSCISASDVEFISQFGCWFIIMLQRLIDTFALNVFLLRIKCCSYF